MDMTRTMPGQEYALMTGPTPGNSSLTRTLISPARGFPNMAQAKAKKMPGMT